MEKLCGHSQTKVDTKTGERPRHICLRCGLILNAKSKITEPKKTKAKVKDASNPKEKKV